MESIIQFVYRICNECGEGFCTTNVKEWREIRKGHKSTCTDATFRTATEDEAF